MKGDMTENSTKIYIYIKLCIGFNESYPANAQPIENDDIPEEPNELRFAFIII